MSRERKRNGPSFAERRANAKARKQAKERDNLDEADEAVFRYIMSSFEHFAPEGQAIDEESAVRLCLAANCRTRETAVAVLRRMARLGFLENSTQGSQVVYRIKPQLREPAN